MLRLTGLALAVSTVALVGCTDGPTVETPEHRIDLRVATGRADLAPSGVAVDPTGARFVFDEDQGLYRFGAGGALDLVMPMAQMPDPGVLVRPPFTDIVAVGPEQFAITAIGDGYLLDTALGTMRRYFCYVPDGLPEPYDQRTDAVTFDPVARLLYAQPRTFAADGTLLDAQVASYSVETGADLEWFGVPLGTEAGGMAKVPGIDGLVLGDGSRLLQFAGGDLTELDDLARLGIDTIAGLAVDATAGTLLVLDGGKDALVELDLADLAEFRR